MNFLRSIITELLGLFVDDGSLALFTVVLIAVLTLAVIVIGLPPLIGAVALFVGCLAILVESLMRAVRGGKR